MSVYIVGTTCNIKQDISWDKSVHWLHVCERDQYSKTFSFFSKTDIPIHHHWHENASEVTG